MRNISLILICLFAFCAPYKAQLSSHYLVNAGYSYYNHHFADIGGKLLLLENDEVIFRAGLGVMLGSSEKKFLALPKASADILFNFKDINTVKHGYYYLAGLDLSTKNIAPKVGISILGLVDFTVGYSFPIGTLSSQKALRGFSSGLSISVPIVMVKEVSQ